MSISVLKWSKFNVEKNVTCIILAFFIDGFDRQFEVYKCDIETPGFRDFHSRIQPLLLFYVDAASYIDVDDDRWMYFLVYGLVI